jgi:hypothetical protein
MPPRLQTSVLQLKEPMPEHKEGKEKKKGVHVKVTDLETGRELFSQELKTGFAACCTCTCCSNPPETN